MREIAAKLRQITRHKVANSVLSPIFVLRRFVMGDDWSTAKRVTDIEFDLANAKIKRRDQAFKRAFMRGKASKAVRD